MSQLPDLASMDVAGLSSALRALILQPPALSQFQALRPQTVPARGSLIRELEATGLTDDAGIPRFRLNLLRGATFLTDLPVHGHEGGVFPYSDESELLLRYMNRRGLGNNHDGIVDLATGCGHTAVASGIANRMALDTSKRAIEFVRLNATINGRPTTALVNDVRLGLPEVPFAAPLFVANMPHAPSPSQLAVPGYIDGGRSGTDLTEAALDCVARTRKAGACIIALCYSLGRTETRTWKIHEHAKKYFQASDVTWDLAHGEKMWRINGKKTHPNPMPLTSLAAKADCRFYVKTEGREAVRRDYEQLASALENDGWDVLGYGFLEIHL